MTGNGGAADPRKGAAKDHLKGVALDHRPDEVVPEVVQDGLGHL